MNFTSKYSNTKEFERIINKCNHIFDEILLKLASENTPLEKEIFLLKKDILFLVLVIIMIENGFQLKVNDGSLIEDSDIIDLKRLSKWKLSSGLYEAEFVLLGYSEISTKLIMIPLNSTVLVNVVINEIDSETYSVCLSVDHYVVLTIKETTIPNLFRNLQELSDIFKNKVLSPVKSKLLSVCGYPGASLIGVPEDVFLKIMFYLPISDIISVCKTCKTFKQVFDNDNVWHRLIIRDYQITGVDEDINWQLLYKESYMKCKNKKKQPYPRLRLPPFFAWIF